MPIIVIPRQLAEELRLAFATRTIFDGLSSMHNNERSTGTTQRDGPQQQRTIIVAVWFRWISENALPSISKERHLEVGSMASALVRARWTPVRFSGGAEPFLDTLFHGRYSAETVGADWHHTYWWQGNLNAWMGWWISSIIVLLLGETDRSGTGTQITVIVD